MTFQKSKLTIALIAAGVALMACPSQGATQTDSRIEASFSKLYACKVYLRDDAIKAISRDGVVTLTGQVNEVSHKELAEEAAAGLPGVLRVENRLEVKLEGTEKSDAWIQSKVRSVLALHRNVSGSHTQVDVKDGVITLRGVATSEAQKELASQYAEDVHGVLRVANVMTVVKSSAKAGPKPSGRVDDASITAQVKVALLLHRSTSSLSTKAATSKGVVTVSGVARSEAERALVTKLAEDIVGVKKVVNNMTVSAGRPQADANPVQP